MALNKGFPVPITLRLRQAHNRISILLCAAKWNAKVLTPEEGTAMQSDTQNADSLTFHVLTSWITAECPGAGRNSVSFCLCQHFRVSCCPCEFLPFSSRKSVSAVSYSRFSSALLFIGEPTIWIQDDGLKVLHHYQERYGGHMAVIYGLFFASLLEHIVCSIIDYTAAFLL